MISSIYMLFIVYYFLFSIIIQCARENYITNCIKISTNKPYQIKLGLIIGTYFRLFLYFYHYFHCHITTKFDVQVSFRFQYEKHDTIPGQLCQAVSGTINNCLWKVMLPYTTEPSWRFNLNLMEKGCFTYSIGFYLSYILLLYITSNKSSKTIPEIKTWKLYPFMFLHYTLLLAFPGVRM